MLWQKEAMINVGLRLLPPSIEYVAWVDHDILIDDPDWPAASVDLIGDRPISVQPWGRMRYLDRTGRTIRQAESATAIAKSGRYPSTGPGAAWVARRRDLEEIGGIYASNIVGGGDLVWFHALSGMRVDFLKRQSPAVRAHQEAWIAHVGGRINYACHPAPASHIWHGDVKFRQHVPQDEILNVHHFDPQPPHRARPPTPASLAGPTKPPNALKMTSRPTSSAAEKTADKTLATDTPRATLWVCRSGRQKPPRQPPTVCPTAGGFFVR